MATNKMDNEPLKRDHLSVNEAAGMLGISRWTVYRLIDNKILPSFTVRGTNRVLLQRSDVESLIIPRGKVSYHNGASSVDRRAA